MKKPGFQSPFVFPVILALLLLFNFSLSGQDPTTVSPSLPDSINAIVSVSGAMPPKSARQKSPEKIPTKEQVAVIKNWSEALNK